MRRFGGLIIGLLCAVALALPAASAAAVRAPDIVLTGQVSRSDHQTFREVPFRLPAGVRRLKVELQHDGAATHAVLDLGVRDPRRMRGWSGGARTGFEISETDATPGYLPGPLPAGVWRVVLGVPNVRRDAVARYTLSVWFDRGGGEADPVFAPRVREGAAWYRGDLHLHSAHSDGRCASATGRPTPCPVFVTLEAARRAHLDFVAMSEHNTVSQAEAVRELAAYFDDLLVIPAREITTFDGHANVFGTWEPLDFRLGKGDAAGLSRLLDAVDAAGGLLSPNHPGLPSGEVCMGCGWTAETDWRRIHALEVVSGGAPALGMEGPFSGLALWNRLLDEGRQVTAIGGSDTHDPGRSDAGAPRVGRPATVVFAEGLSTPEILAGIRAGRVFIDLAGDDPGVRLDYAAATPGGARAVMGGRLPAPEDAFVDVEVTLVGAPPGARLRSAGGVSPIDLPVAGSLVLPRLKLLPGARWFRFELVGGDGRRRLIGNPIYLSPAASNQ